MKNLLNFTWYTKQFQNCHHTIVRAVNGLSYNQLVEKIIANKNNTDNNLVTESLVAQNFLEESASQLTYHGLCELGTTMKENELAIFFRNNHFSTIYKRNNVRYFYDLLLYLYWWEGGSDKCFVYNLDGHVFLMIFVFVQ